MNKKSNVIRINQGRIFSSISMVLVLLFSFAGMFYSIIYFEETISILVCILLTVPTILMWSSFHYSEIDLKNNLFSYGWWVAGFQKFYKKETLKPIGIKIRKNPYSGGGNFFLKNRQNKKFKAFIATESNGEIYLFGSHSEEALKSKILAIDGLNRFEINTVIT